MRHIMFLIACATSGCYSSEQADRLADELAERNKHISEAPGTGPSIGDINPNPTPVTEAAPPPEAEKPKARPVPVLYCRHSDALPKRQIAPGTYRFDFPVAWSEYGQETYEVGGLREAKHRAGLPEGFCLSGGHFVPVDIVTQIRSTDLVELWRVADGAYTRTPPTVPKGQPVPPPDLTVRCLRLTHDSCQMKGGDSVVAVNTSR